MFNLRFFSRPFGILRANIRYGRRNFVFICSPNQKAHRCLLETKRFDKPLVKQSLRNLHSQQFNKTPILNTEVSVSVKTDFIVLSWNDNTQSKFHHIWLRDHCRCLECYNHDTHQKEADILQFPLDIKPSSVELLDGKEIKIIWPDKHKTVYSIEWLRQHSYGGGEKESQSDEVILWNSNIASNLPEPITFEEAMQREEQLFEVCQRIVNYGFAFLEKTPCDLEAIEKLSTKLGGFVKETHYGRLWEFGTSGLEFADTAYTSQAILCHTDATYFTDPAGLQLLHCIEHDGQGGMSLLVDGFNAAEILQKSDPESFHFLSTNKMTFHYFDKGKEHFMAHGPMIELHPFCGRVTRIRYNPHDLAPLNSFSADDIPRFYKAFKAFSAILRAPNNEFKFKLSPGKLLIAGNWKVLHGRTEFTGKRTMQGCYVNRDDFLSKFRTMREKRF